MVKNESVKESTSISEIIIHGIQEKKGKDIVRLDLQKIHSSLVDYFVICHAESSTQVLAIALNIEKEVYAKSEQYPWKKEGFQNGEWVLLDYVDVVVHIFKTDKREYYGIEELWGHADIRVFKSA